MNVTDRAQGRQGLAGPRHLLAGNMRRNVERLAILGAVAPFLVLFCAVVLSAFMAPWLMVVLVVATAGTLYALPGARQEVARNYYRARWYLDARAAGLALEAEPSVLPGRDKLTDERVVVVPRCRIQMTGNGGRRYRIRPLPGQTLGDFDQAVPRLSVRWGCNHVSLEAPMGSKYVWLNVAAGDPPVSTYDRGGAVDEYD